MKVFIFFVILVFMIACDNKDNNHKENKNPTQKEKNISNIVKTENIPNKKIKEENKKMDLLSSFKDKSLLLFVDDSKISQNQIKELNNYKQKFYKIDNDELKLHFNIKSYPTIIIVDKNKTKKYEGFIPYQILKYELKD